MKLVAGTHGESSWRYPGRPQHETEESCGSEKPSSGEGADEAFPNGIELGTILSLSNPGWQLGEGKGRSGGGGGTGHGKVVAQVKRGVLAAASDIVCFKVRPRLVSQPNAGGSGQGRRTSLRLSWG
jgi:hypothetical protein